MSAKGSERQPLGVQDVLDSWAYDRRALLIATGVGAVGIVAAVSSGIATQMQATAYMRKRDDTLYDYLSVQGPRLEQERRDVMDAHTRFSEGGKETNPTALAEVKKHMELLEILIGEHNDRIDLLAKNRGRAPLQYIASVYEPGEHIKFGTNADTGEPLDMEVITPPGGGVERVPK